MLNIAVLNTGSSVVQEIWTNVPGINVADIPTSTPANITNVARHAGRHHQLRRQLRRAHPRLFHRAGHGQLLFLDRRQRLGGALDFRRQRPGQQSPARVGHADQQSHRARPERHLAAPVEFAVDPAVRLALACRAARNITSKFCTRPASARTTTGRSAGCRTRPAPTPRPPA